MNLLEIDASRWPHWRSDDGNVLLINADCLEVLPTLPGGTINAVITDPPYSSGTRREGSKGVRKSMNRTTGDDDWFGSDCMTTQGFVWTMRAVASQSKRLLIPGGHMLAFIDWRMSDSLASAIESTDMRRLGLIVWDKMCFGMGTYFRNQHELILHFSHGRTRSVFRHDVGNVLQVSRMIDGAEHDTQKPVELMEPLITTVTDGGESVLDPFSGSATTGVACVRLGRQFIGIELEPRYYEIAIKRIKAEIERFPLFEQVEAKERTLFDEVAE